MKWQEKDHVCQQLHFKLVGQSKHLKAPWDPHVHVKHRQRKNCTGPKYLCLYPKDWGIMSIIHWKSGFSPGLYIWTFNSFRTDTQKWVFYPQESFLQSLFLRKFLLWYSLQWSYLAVIPKDALVSKWNSSASFVSLCLYLFPYELHSTTTGYQKLFY